jgi:hypothetical protein
MDLCRNEAPLIWLARSRGYDLTPLETEMERRLRLEREKTDELEREKHAAQKAADGEDGVKKAHCTLIEMQAFAAACIQFDGRVPKPHNPYLFDDGRHRLWQQAFEAAQKRVRNRFGASEGIDYA